MNFVDRQEFDLHIARHRLDGRYPIARFVRLDFFFAGDQRYSIGTNARFDFVVDFARKQTKRQTDHAAFVAKHTLNREVRFAGIRWP